MITFRRFLSEARSSRHTLLRRRRRRSFLHPRVSWPTNGAYERMFATNHTEQEEAVEMLPGEVSRRLKLFHQEQLRQQQHQGVQFSSSPTSTLDSGILDAKVIKKKISDN